MKKEMIEKLLRENEGIIKVAQVTAAGISRDTFYRYAREMKLDQMARGIYISLDAWADELYLMQLQIPKGIYSHETALYLHGLAEKEPMPFTVTVPSHYNSAMLKKKHLEIVYVKKEWYELGVCQMPTMMGHQVLAYDMERTVCDVIRKRRHMDIAVSNYALVEYMHSREKNLNRLVKYAKIMGIEKKLKEVMGVLF